MLLSQTGLLRTTICEFLTLEELEAREKSLNVSSRNRKSPTEQGSVLLQYTSKTFPSFSAFQGQTSKYSVRKTA